MSSWFEDEYRRRMKKMGYEPTMDGMDDQDVKDALEAMDRRNSRQQEEWQYPRYKPVDPGLQARILRMFGQPYDPKYIREEEKYYLNGWDNGDDDDDPPQAKPAPNLFAPSQGRGRQANNPWTLNWGRGGTETGMQPLSAKTSSTNWWIDPKGMYPQYGGEAQNPLPDEQASSAPAASKSPQALWDEHIWNSFDVISAQTPKEKRAAVNRIIKEKQAEFDAAYEAAHGDKAAARWENDQKFTLSAMGDYVTADQLKAFGWQNVTDDMVKDLNNALVKYDITSPSRIRHFLSQAAKESDMGRSTLEYGDDDYWNANGYGRKYRGAGYIQMTWPDAYEKFAKEVNDDDVVNIGAEHVAKKYPWLASAFWWHKLNQMNDLVDEFDGADTDADVERVTRRVNGEPDWNDEDTVNRWRKSLKERQEHYKRSRNIFPD